MFSISIEFFRNILENNTKDAESSNKKDENKADTNKTVSKEESAQKESEEIQKSVQVQQAAENGIKVQSSEEDTEIEFVDANLKKYRCSYKLLSLLFSSS